MGIWKRSAHGQPLAEPNVEQLSVGFLLNNWKETLLELPLTFIMVFTIFDTNGSFILNQNWCFSSFHFLKLSPTTFNLFAHYFQVKLFGLFRDGY